MAGLCTSDGILLAVTCRWSARSFRTRCTNGHPFTVTQDWMTRVVPRVFESYLFVTF